MRAQGEWISVTYRNDPNSRRLLVETERKPGPVFLVVNKHAAAFLASIACGFVLSTNDEPIAWECEDVDASGPTLVLEFDPALDGGMPRVDSA
jgi:hypothetical protein